MNLTSATDLTALKARGFDAVYPAQTPYDMIAASAARAPQATAIRFLRDADDPSRDLCLTYADLMDHIHAAANLFRDMRVGPAVSEETSLSRARRLTNLVP
jgi:fatty-acyl-CoA synthase